MTLLPIAAGPPFVRLMLPSVRVTSPVCLSILNFAPPAAALYSIPFIVAMLPAGTITVPFFFTVTAPSFPVFATVTLPFFVFTVVLAPAVSTVSARAVLTVLSIVDELSTVAVTVKDFISPGLIVLRFHEYARHGHASKYEDCIYEDTVLFWNTFFPPAPWFPPTYDVSIGVSVYPSFNARA